MEEIIKKIQEQNFETEDYLTMVKIIQSGLQRGAIRAEECTTVGKLYDKIIFHLKKLEKDNA